MVLEVKNIVYYYKTNKSKNVLNGISYKFEEGRVYAILGASGSGKTTLSKLLLHLYDTESGDILINGNNIDDIRIECLREKIAYIPQETFLFSGTIFENLTLGMDKATMNDIMEAAKMAQAHDFINELPLRYETRLEENGANFSGGGRDKD